MFAEYKREVSHNYLILHGDETINTTSYQVRILTGNTMSSILKCLRKCPSLTPMNLTKLSS